MAAPRTFVSTTSSPAVPDWGPMLLCEQVAVVVAVGVPAAIAAEADEELWRATYGSVEDRRAVADSIRRRFEAYLSRQLRGRAEIKPQAIGFGVTQMLLASLDRVEERLITGVPSSVEEKSVH